jgi:ribonuclease PH
MQLKIQPNVIIDTIGAISVGIKDGGVLVDLDYNEDSSCDVDMNFVMTGKGAFVEVQGTAEKKPFTKANLDQMTEAATAALAEIREIQLKAIGT